MTFETGFALFLSGLLVMVIAILVYALFQIKKGKQ